MGFLPAHFNVGLVERIHGNTEIVGFYGQLPVETAVDQHQTLSILTVQNSKEQHFTPSTVFYQEMSQTI